MEFDSKGNYVASPSPSESDNAIGSYPRHSEVVIEKQGRNLSLSAYLIALRPWSLSTSLVPVALGSTLAYKSVGSFNILCFFWTCLAALSVHAAGNLVNTYFDYKRGVDSKKSDESDNRILVDNILNPNDVATMGGLFYLLGCFSFLCLVLTSPARMEQLALVYFGGLSSSFLYTGGLGLKYIALGDIVIFLTFGPIAVLFAYMSQGGLLSWLPLLYAIPLALNTEAILHCNNSRDREIDADAGIVTLAILIGKTGSYALFVLLLFVPYIMFALLMVHFSSWYLLPLLTVFFAFRCEKAFRDGQLVRLPHAIARLNIVLGTTFLLACILTPSKKLPLLSASASLDAFTSKVTAA